MVLKWKDYSSLSSRDLCNHKGLSKREAGWSESEEQFECYAAGIEGGGRD